MIDFARLLNRTPEERAADDARARQREADEAARIQGLVAVRSGQVDDLNHDRVRASLSVWERDFVRSMASRAASFDVATGLMGGRLAWLSEKETPIFERLVREHLPPVQSTVTTVADGPADESSDHAAEQLRTDGMSSSG